MELAAQTGLVVRGYKSPIDGSDQPYGLEVPEEPAPPHGFPLCRLRGIWNIVYTTKPQFAPDFAPKFAYMFPRSRYVWLHGSAGTTTDLRFIHGCQTTSQPNNGKPTPAGAMVIHPFGRHCNGYKWVGEIDVLDAVAHVQTLYTIDPERIILAGFSMGGAVSASNCEINAFFNTGSSFLGGILHYLCIFNRISKRFWHSHCNLYTQSHQAPTSFNSPAWDVSDRLRVVAQGTWHIAANYPAQWYTILYLK